MVQSKEQETDDVIMILLLLTGAAGLGLFSIGSLLEPVQVWLVDAHVLVAGDAVLLGWGEQPVGLDLARVVIVAGVVVLFLVMIVAVVRRRMARDA